MPTQTFFSAIFLVVLAEIGDKTMLTTLCFSAQQKRPIVILATVTLALSIASVFAVLLGIILSTTIPFDIVIPISALLFIIAGFIIALNHNNESQTNCIQPKTLFGMFSLVLSSEIGDKSQIVIVALAAESPFPFLVVIGSITGFVIVNAIAAFFGSSIAEIIPMHIIHFITALIFILFGIITIFDFMYK